MITLFLPPRFTSSYPRIGRPISPYNKTVWLHYLAQLQANQKLPEPKLTDMLFGDLRVDLMWKQRHCSTSVTVVSDSSYALDSCLSARQANWSVCREGGSACFSKLFFVDTLHVTPHTDLLLHETPACLYAWKHKHKVRCDKHFDR